MPSRTCSLRGNTSPVYSSRSVSWRSSPSRLRGGILLCLALGGCESLGQLRHLSRVSATPQAGNAAPAILAPFRADAEITRASEWESRRAPLLRAVFLEEQYGIQPDFHEVSASTPQVIDDNAFHGKARLEQVTLTIRTRFGEGKWRETPMRVLIARPKAATGSVPVILKMNYCPFSEVFRHEGAPGPEFKFEGPELRYSVRVTCQTKGFRPAAWILDYSLGRYHVAPPVEMMITRGYAFAAINPFDFVADADQLSKIQLEWLSNGAPPETRWGALSAWAFQFSRAVDYLSTDSGLDASRIAVYGHSRYGKAALLAGALDPRIGAVIAHQAGRGGPALSASTQGEPLAQMIADYPNWLSPAFSAAQNEARARDFDQHQLLALLAPRPVLLGHGRRDSWSDPQGAFRAAKGANPVFALYGASGLSAKRLNQFKPADSLSFWFRGGTHGEVREDWPAFLKFLDAHFRDAHFRDAHFRDAHFRDAHFRDAHFMPPRTPVTAALSQIPTPPR